jgi:hypothetical protein
MKKIKKVSINLTEEQYDLLNALARMERRSVSELAALIVVDTSQVLFLERQEKGTIEVARFVPNQWEQGK